MTDESLLKERNLQHRMQELAESRSIVRENIEKLTQDKKVQEYIELKIKEASIEDKIESCSRQIININMEDCTDYNHAVLLYLGKTGDSREGYSYEAYCLNCGKIVETCTGDMEKLRMLNIKAGVVNIHEMMEKASKDYRLFRSCYYKYPKALKKKDCSSRIIYKAMRKRYGTK